MPLDPKAKLLLIFKDLDLTVGEGTQPAPFRAALRFSAPVTLLCNPNPQLPRGAAVDLSPTSSPCKYKSCSSAIPVWEVCTSRAKRLIYGCHFSPRGHLETGCRSGSNWQTRSSGQRMWKLPPVQCTGTRWQRLFVQRNVEGKDLFLIKMFYYTNT